MDIRPLNLSPYDRTLIAAAGDLSCWQDGRDLHSRVVQALRDGLTGPEGILYGALYAVSAFEPDTLLALLLRVDDTQSDLATAHAGSKAYEHDSPCRIDGDGLCVDCVNISEQEADAALRELRTFLGETAGADQVIAA